MSDPHATTPIVVFDLDHTLVRCDSFAGYSTHLIRRRAWRTGLALLASPVVLALLIPPRTRLLAGSVLVWCGTVGLTEAELEELMDRHVARRFGGVRALVCQGAVDALLEHRRRGDRVLVATGCVASLAERVCREIGIGQIEVVGSTLRRGWGGWIADRHCFGPAKLTMLTERGHGASFDWVYTDSAFDLPILRCGNERYLVNPTARDRLRVTAELGSAVTIVDWR